MARVVITVTDNDITGDVGFHSTPDVRELLERKQRFGPSSLSRGETYAVIALNHMLQNAVRDDEARGKRPNLIVPS